MTWDAFVILTACASSLPCAAARAQGVGTGSPTHTAHALEVLFGIPDNPASWRSRVGSSAHPLSVELDPNGPVWVKNFELDVSVFPSVYPQQVLVIAEHLIVQGDLPWTGWSTVIGTPDFVWYAGPHVHSRARTDSGGVPVFINGQVNPADPSTLNFVLPTASRGTAIELVTYVLYSGEQPFAGSLELHQYPTPEPASALLLACGLTVTALRRR